MKMKNLISIFGNHVSTFVFTLLSALMLTACGEEVNIEGPGTSEEGLTVFSQVSDGTRTTMDTDGLFYWQSMNVNNVITNDQIWIDEAGTGASFSLQSASSEFESDKRTGKFYFSKALGNDTYRLSYTGFGSTTGDKVTIAAEQQQSGWNNSDHIGTSGDCATATATKVTGTNNYTFKLDHKASYLIFQPYAKKKTPGATNIYRLTEIEITDTDGNPLAGIFPLTYDGLQTNGAENTSNQIRLTCNQGFELPEDAPAATATAYVVMLPRGYRNLRVAYRVSTVSDGNFQVYQNISGTYGANNARLIKHEISVPDVPTVPTFVSDGNGLFGGTKFKPAFLRRTNGNATTGATLQLDADPFILLQYNQGAHNVAITEQQKRMFFTWNELAEIFGHASAGNGASHNGKITGTKSINGTSYRMPTSGEYSKMIETPNAGRATVNYYPASFAAVKVDLSADATYSNNKGWDHTAPYNANENANYIMGYLFFPDESVILSSKILVASLNGRWGTTYSELTADDLKKYTAHGCMFLPAAGNATGVSWYRRGIAGYYWSGTIASTVPSQAARLAINSSSLTAVDSERTYYFAAVLVEN